MRPTAEIEVCLKYSPQDLRDIVLELRNIIVSCAPTATEVIRHNGFVYYDKSRGGPVSAGICQIILCQDHIRLAFIHGAFLPDPKNLLEGREKYKRFTRISSYAQAPWEDLQALITASAHFDPYTLSMQK